MNVEFLKSFARESWYLLVVVAVALVAAIYGIATQGSEEVLEPVATVKELPRGLTQDEAQELVKPPPKPPKPTPKEQTDAVISGHQDTIEAAPESKDAPAYLNAMGNLAMNRLGEYERAAGYFEELLTKYRSFPLTNGVYSKLAKCYTKMGNEALTEDVWRRMMNRYPKGTPEYDFARQQLGDSAHRL